MIRFTRRLAWVPPVAAVAVGLAACGGSSSSSSATPASAASGTSSTSASAAAGSGGKHFTIAYVPGATGVAFYDTLLQGMKTEAAQLNMSVIYQGAADFSPSAQTPVVNGVCTRHPDLLVVSPTDPVAMAPALQTCRNEGVPVITVDTTLSNSTGLTSAITTDNAQGGKLAADYVGKKLGGKGTVAVLSLSPTATTQVARVAAFTAELKAAYPGITVLPTQYTAQAVTSSESIVRSLLLAHPGIKAVFGAAEPNAEGAASALAATGQTGKVVIAGFDAGPTEVSLLKAGKIDALVAQQAAQEGATAAQFAHDKLTGDTGAIKSTVQLPDVLLTTSTVASGQKYFYQP